MLGLKIKFLSILFIMFLLTILLACVSYVYWDSLYLQRKASLVNIIETVVSITEYFVNLEKQSAYKARSSRQN